MASTIKVKILTDCDYCEGKAYLPYRESVDYKGNIYKENKPCPQCGGTGLTEKSISISELIRLIEDTDVCEPDYPALAMAEPLSQYIDSLEAAGIR
jgi:hypothetical protein